MTCLQDFDFLSLAGIRQPEISKDYIKRKQQFQLHNLTTEQRHPLTWTLSQTALLDTAQALCDILAVDKNVAELFNRIADEGTKEVWELKNAILRTMKAKGRIFIYGCGAAGRMAKQVESSFWRPFWIRVAQKWPGKFEKMAERLVGEMTGGDRALISSLEGLEDLTLVGELQLKECGITSEDLVIGFSGAGLSSSVLGAVSAARNLFKSSEESCRHVFILFSNPQDALFKFDRCRNIINDSGITKVSLCTGPQAVTGSTRMQATTTAMYLLGVVLEQAICEYFQNMNDLQALGFSLKNTLSERFRDFSRIQKVVNTCAPSLARLTDMETACYKNEARAVYWADSAIISVFTDATERSPTFRLFPLDPITFIEPKCWLRVITPTKDAASAWRYLLQRDFRGLDKELYENPFKENIEDPYLKKLALASLEKAGSNQKELYDFSTANFSDTPNENDFGLITLLDRDILREQHADFLNKFKRAGMVRIISSVNNDEDSKLQNDCVEVMVQSPIFRNDPLTVRQNVALKMLLNAHSTCVMAKMGKLVGNTMTNVSPANLKLIGRATWLILTHANDFLSKYGFKLAYFQANAVLYECIQYAERTLDTGNISEVATSIVFILETIRRQSCVSWPEAKRTLANYGSLEKYLNTVDKLHKNNTHKILLMKYLDKYRR